MADHMMRLCTGHLQPHQAARRVLANLHRHCQGRSNFKEVICCLVSLLAV